MDLLGIDNTTTNDSSTTDLDVVRMIYMDAGELAEQASPEDLIRRPRNKSLKRILGAMSAP
ncbi:MAG: hypothetical protein F4Y40_04050 [Acidimicrobiia bacterium]|nr:hypothetical protein [Acidimicrobiia bacterium]MYF83868.1 hypothetical protein [Acidimicrobiia bacterium]